MNIFPPDEPPRDEPVEHILWHLKNQMIMAMPVFKRGAFKDQVNWAVKLVDCLHMFLNSPLLDKHDKATNIRLESDIVSLLLPSPRSSLLEHPLSEEQCPSKIPWSQIQTPVRLLTCWDL